MQEHGSLTQRDAIRLGCYRLSARIHDLRRGGKEIESTILTVKNADGSTANIASYSIKK